MSSDLVTIDIKNGIADVRLNREEKYNALSQDMFDAIIEAGHSLASQMMFLLSCCPATAVVFVLA